MEAPSTLTLGPTSTLLKTGALTATIGGDRPIGSSDVAALVNRGLIRVAAGTLRVDQADNFFTVTNRGTVQVWQLTSANAISRLADGTVTGTNFVVALPAQSVTLFVVPGSSVATRPAPPTNVRIIR